jgi:hypothetical protein
VEGTTFMWGLEDTRVQARGLQREEDARRHGFGEAIDGDVVREEEGGASIGDDAVAFSDANFFSAVVEDEGLERIRRSQWW